jgi:hypothetical protein
MAGRDGIFAGDDPFVIAQRWLDEAAKTEPNDPSAMALATVDGAGLPDVRMVLLKEIEPQAFVFYTNYESDKGRQLNLTGKAAFVIHWKSLRRQIRVRGDVSRIVPAGRCKVASVLGRRRSRGRSPAARPFWPRWRGRDCGTGSIRRGRPSGADSASGRCRSSSGQMAPSGCMTVSDGVAGRGKSRGRSSVWRPELDGFVHFLLRKIVNLPKWLGMRRNLPYDNPDDGC